jgi:hypothetical protein
VRPGSYFTALGVCLLRRGGERGGGERGEWGEVQQKGKVTALVQNWRVGYNFNIEIYRLEVQYRIVGQVLWYLYIYNRKHRLEERERLAMARWLLKD